MAWSSRIVFSARHGSQALHATVLVILSALTPVESATTFATLPHIQDALVSVPLLSLSCPKRMGTTCAATRGRVSTGYHELRRALPWVRVGLGGSSIVAHHQDSLHRPGFRRRRRLFSDSSDEKIGESDG
jgi:hypothetical protein